MAGEKGLLDNAQDKATAVAKKGAKEVKSVASEALTAAAAAAAAAAGGVVLDRMAVALQKGKEKVEEAKPTVQMAAELRRPSKKAVGKKRKMAAKKKTRKTTSKKKSASKAKQANKAKAKAKKTRRRN